MKMKMNGMGAPREVRWGVVRYERCWRAKRIQIGPSRGGSGNCVAGRKKKGRATLCARAAPLPPLNTHTHQRPPTHTRPLVPARESPPQNPHHGRDIRAVGRSRGRTGPRPPRGLRRGAGSGLSSLERGPLLAAACAWVGRRVASAPRRHAQRHRRLRCGRACAARGAPLARQGRCFRGRAACAAQPRRHQRRWRRWGGLRKRE